MQSVLVFEALSTQWARAGMNGAAAGLVYASIEPVLRLMRVERKAWPQTFLDLQVMEGAALTEMHRQTK